MTDILARHFRLPCPTFGRGCCYIPAAPGNQALQSRSAVFENLDDLYRITRWRGYYGGIRIIQAFIVRLVDYCHEHGIELPDRNFTLEYESNVPQRLGLGGSSAIITASLRALCQYYELDIPLPVQANIALETETRELNVPAGLTGSCGTGLSGAGVYGFLACSDGSPRLWRV